MTEKMNVKQFRDYLDKQEKGRNSKYGGIPTQTADGKKFDSHVEAMYYNRCLTLEKAGEITLLEMKVRYEFHVNGVFIGWYELDFRITNKDGTIEYIDTKSKATLTPVYRIKKQLMLACHGITLKEVYAEDFERQNK